MFGYVARGRGWLGGLPGSYTNCPAVSVGRRGGAPDGGTVVRPGTTHTHEGCQRCAGLHAMKVKKEANKLPWLRGLNKLSQGPTTRGTTHEADEALAQGVGRCKPGCRQLLKFTLVFQSLLGSVARPSSDKSRCRQRGMDLDQGKLSEVSVSFCLILFSESSSVRLTCPILLCVVGFFNRPV